MLAAQQAAGISGIQSTAGAVPVRNEKGKRKKNFCFDPFGTKNEVPKVYFDELKTKLFSLLHSSQVNCPCKR